MKTLLLMLLTVATTYAGPLEDGLRNGLYEEEANRDLPAAIAAYESALQHFDSQRQVAATTIFRLAECYAESGEEEKAKALYARISREFGDLEKLSILAGERRGADPVRPLSPAQRRIKEIEELLQRSPDLVNKIGNDTNLTLLEEAVAAQQPEVVKYLLSAGAKPGFRNALHRAAELPDPNILDQLLEAGADPNQRYDLAGTISDVTPLHIATARGHLGSAKRLIESGADLSIRAYISTDFVPEILLKKINPIKKKNVAIYARGITALDIAVFSGFDALTAFLAESATSLENSDQIFRAAFQTAAKVGSEQIIDRLLKAGAAPESMALALAYALDKSDATMTELLLRKGADPKAEIYDGQRALHIAAKKGFKEGIELLAAQDVDFNVRDDRGDTPIFLLRRPSPEVVQLMIDNSAEPNLRGGNGEPLLNLAVSNPQREGWSDIESIKLLLENGADPNLRSEPEGETALFSAIYPIGRDGAATELLLEYGADPDVKNASDHKADHDYGRRNESNRILTKHRIYSGNERSQKVSVVVPEVANYQTAAQFTMLEGEPCRYKLLELIAACGKHAVFGKARILRLEASEPLEIDVHEILEAKDPAKDVALQWGDVVELSSLPELGSKVSRSAAEFLDGYLKREVKAVSFGALEKDILVSLVPTSWQPVPENGFVVPSDQSKYENGLLTGARNSRNMVSAFLEMKAPRGSQVTEITRRSPDGSEITYTGSDSTLPLDGDVVRVFIERKPESSDKNAAIQRLMERARANQGRNGSH